MSEHVRDHEDHNMDVTQVEVICYPVTWDGDNDRAYIWADDSAWIETRGAPKFFCNDCGVDLEAPTTEWR